MVRQPKSRRSATLYAHNNRQARATLTYKGELTMSLNMYRKSIAPLVAALAVTAIAQFGANAQVHKQKVIKNDGKNFEFSVTLYEGDTFFTGNIGRTQAHFVV